MSSVATIMTTLAATAGAVALGRYIGRRAKQFRDDMEKARRAASDEVTDGVLLDFEQDPQTGVFGNQKQNTR